jgi:predicted lipid-binding transport protein (Tim44 family)
MVARAQNSGSQLDTGRPSPDRGPPSGTLQGGLDKIRATDTNFSQQVFVDRVQTAFYAIQTAWQKCDLDGTARQHLSDAMVQRFQMQINDMKQKGQHNVLDSLVVGGVHLVDANQEGGYDSIQVKIVASCADYTVDDKSGQLVDGSRYARPFIEYWTFVRAAGVKTALPGAAASHANNCPSCGAPISMGETGRCAFCDSEVKRMNFDWVLNNITQASEI